MKTRTRVLTKKLLILHLFLQNWRQQFISCNQYKFFFQPTFLILQRKFIIMQSGCSATNFNSSDVEVKICTFKNNVR